MTLLALDGIVAELLARLRANSGQPVDVSASDLRGWLPEVVHALLAGNVLLPAEPASSVVCDGCEEACVRPVQTRTRQSGETAAFVICDVREDIATVFVNATDLRRWRFTVDSLAAGIAALLANGGATAVDASGKSYRLGFVEGRHHDRAVLYMQNDDGAKLMLAGHVLAPEDVLMLSGDRLSLHARTLTRCLDAPIGSTASLEVPADRRIRLRERVGREKGKRTRNFLQVVAGEEGISVARLKQLLKEIPPPPSKTAAADWTTTFAGLSSPSSKKGTPRR